MSGSSQVPVSARLPAWRRWVHRTGSLVIGRRDAWLAALGIALGLLVTEAIARALLGTARPWFVVPMGASAVLLFALPASPLAQPWPVLAGNTVSALCGVLCHRWLGDSGLAAGAAAGLAVGAMASLRCLHPPGGAVAVTAVLGGGPVHALGLGFAAVPVLLDSVLLAGLAVLFHAVSGHRYPHRAPVPASGHRTADPPPSRRVGIRPEDMDAALAGYGEVLDVDREDLAELLVRARLQARRRAWGGLRCRDILARDVVTVAPDMPVAEAWRRLARHRIASLPVVTPDGRLAGIVSLPDFFLDPSDPHPPERPRMAGAATVADLMTREVFTAAPDQPLADLVDAFSDRGLHHLPVTDGDGRLVGMVTQSDVVAALFAGERAA